MPSIGFSIQGALDTFGQQRLVYLRAPDDLEGSYDPSTGTIGQNDVSTWQEIEVKGIWLDDNEGEKGQFPTVTGIKRKVLIHYSEIGITLGSDVYPTIEPKLTDKIKLPRVSSTQGVSGGQSTDFVIWDIYHIKTRNNIVAPLWTFFVRLP